MDKYIVGYSLQGYLDLDLNSDSLNEIKDSLVIVVLDEKSNGKLYTYYSAVRSLIVSNNKVILLLIEAKSPIRKQISMLLMSYRNYNIYTLDDRSIIDREYLATIEGREPSEDEVTTFVGSDITAYSEINDILLRLTSKVEESDIDGLREIIESKRDSIEGFVDIIDYMKKVVDNANSGETDKQIKSLKDKISELENSLEDATKQIREAKKEAELALKDQETLKKEAFQAKQKAADLEDRLNSKEPVLTTYTELQTQMIKCNTKVILYFKEVSHISYISSMLIKMCEVLVRLKKLKVKLLIYDNKHSLLSTYKPIPVIGSNEYMSNKDSVVNKLDKLVIVEANQAIIEDILKADWDVVIVYDRLRQASDIVSGNNVFKYWVMNSMSEYKALFQAFKIEERNIISRPGIFAEGIAISEIKEYKTHTPSAKLAGWVNMLNIGENKGKVFDLIFQRTNISALQGRGRD